MRLQQTKRFSKDLKRAVKRGKDLRKIKMIVSSLAKSEPLHPKHRDHSLIGDWKGSRECHIEPDWLLIYTIEVDEDLLRLERTGTHSDLFF